MSKKKPVNKPSPKKRIVSSASKAASPTQPKVVGAVAPEVASRNVPAQTEVVLPFARRNYLLLLLGIGIIGIGFFLMSLDPFIDAKEFSISLYVAPIVVVAGFLEVIYAIMYRDKSRLSSDS